jgi:small subunit ribosomal protein S29
VKAEEGKKTLRVVVDGERGTGKSLMLVHAMASACVRGWVLFNIPEGMCSPFQRNSFQDISRRYP